MYIKISIFSNNWNLFAWMKFDYSTICILNNKGADQIARMHRLVCTFVVCMQQSK